MKLVLHLACSNERHEQSSACTHLPTGEEGICWFPCAWPLPMDSCSGSDCDAAAIWSQVWALGATHVLLMVLEWLLVKSSLTKLRAKNNNSLVTKTLCNMHPSSRSSQRCLMNYFVVDTGQSWCPEFMKRRWKPRITRWAGGGSPYTPLRELGKYVLSLLPTDCHHDHWGQAAGGWEHRPHSNHWDRWWEEANNSERRHKCSLLQWGWCFLLGKTFSSMALRYLHLVAWTGMDKLVESGRLRRLGRLFSSKGVWAFPFVLGTRKALCHAHHHLSNSQILFSRLCGVTEKANPWCWQCCYQHKEDSDLLSPSSTVLCVWFRWTTGVSVRQNNQHLCKYLGKPSTVIVSVSFWLWMFLPNAIKKRNNVWYQGCYESNRKCWKRKGEWRGKVGKAAGNYLNESKAKLKGRWGVDFQGHTLLAWHSVRQKDKLHLRTFTRS